MTIQTKNSIAIIAIITIFTFGRHWYLFAMNLGISEKIASRHYFILEMVSWLITALWFIKRNSHGGAGYLANWLIALIVHNIIKDMNLELDPHSFGLLNWIIAIVTGLYCFIEYKTQRQKDARRKTTEGA